MESIGETTHTSLQGRESIRFQQRIDMGFFFLLTVKFLGLQLRCRKDTSGKRKRGNQMRRSPNP